MADTKISDLPANAGLADTDAVPIADDQGGGVFATQKTTLLAILTYVRNAIVKADVGLGNVDNTSDANKPVSTAQQTALDGKSNVGHTHTASQVTDFDAAVAANSAVAANTAKVTNATHTGDVTGSDALTIANDAVTNAKAANMAQNTIKGRITASTGDPEDLTAAQAKSILAIAAGDVSGLAAIATSGSASDLGSGTLPAARFDDTAHGSRGGAALHAAATTGVNGFMSAADKTKLDGVATGATANSSDATLLARANHTGTQAISTVTGLQTALDGKQPVNSGELTVENLGTVSSGTQTPNPSGGAMKRLTNNGAFTLAATSQTGFYTLKVTNGASAGAITFSGFTTVTNGDTYATTNGKTYEFAVTAYGDGVVNISIKELT